MEEKKLSKINISNRRMIILATISIFLIVAIVFGYQIENYSAINIGWSTIIALLCGIIVIFICLYGLFHFFDFIKLKNNIKQEVSKTKTFMLVFGIIMLVYLFQFLVLYPGLFVFDSGWQYTMYKGYVSLTDQHPLLHTLLMGFVVDCIYQMTGNYNWGVAIYTILQMVICALSFSYMITYIYEKVRVRFVLILSTIFVSFHPTIVLQVMSATKDTWFMAFVILSIVLSLELFERPKEFLNSPTKCVSWIVSVLLMVIFRNNCIYALPALLFFLFIHIKKEKKRYVGIILILGTVFLLYKCVFVPNVIVEKTDAREMLSVPIQQLMRIYYTESADIEQEEKEIIENLIGEYGRERYDPKISDFPKAFLNMDYYKENQSEINGLYTDLVKRNLKLSMESFLENTCGFWYPLSKLTIMYDTEGYWVFIDHYYSIANSKLPVVYDFYKSFETYEFAEGKPLTMLFYAPATYFYIFFVMTAYAIDQNKKKFISVCTFILMLWCTYLLGPVALVRYTTYLFAMVPLYFVIIMEKEDKTINIDEKNM